MPVKVLKSQAQSNSKWLHVKDIQQDFFASIIYLPLPKYLKYLPWVYHLFAYFQKEGRRPLQGEDEIEEALCFFRAWKRSKLCAAEIL